MKLYTSYQSAMTCFLWIDMVLKNVENNVLTCPKVRASGFPHVGDMDCWEKGSYKWNQMNRVNDSARTAWGLSKICYSDKVINLFATRLHWNHLQVVFLSSWFCIPNSAKPETGGHVCEKLKTKANEMPDFCFILRFHGLGKLHHYFRGNRYQFAT